MKKTILVFMSLLLILNLGCTFEKGSEGDTRDISLEGTWRLVKTIEIGHEDTTDRRDSGNKMYMKHLNKTHWTWAEYDYANNRLLGAGGGTYTLEGNIYTEDIQFYYPPGSAELGQAIPFTVEMDGSLWRHAGYVKMMEFDAETGENIVVDSAIIDEYWERVDAKPSDDTKGKLFGTWNLISYKNAEDTLRTEYPAFVGYIKLLTPTHWLYVKYNKEGDEIMGIGGGTYSVSGDRYLEKISFFYPPNTNWIGTTATFTWKMQGEDHWRIVGKVNGRNEDIYAVDEAWQRYGDQAIAKSQ